jgi:sec-independent protein translocase protein TatB
MFDVGFSELLIIAVVALIVLGPERLPKAARFAGLWVRKARAQWYSVKSEFEFEMAQEEMKKHLQDVENSIKAPVLELQESMQQAQFDIEKAVNLDAETAPLTAIEVEPIDAQLHDDAIELNRQTAIEEHAELTDSAETMAESEPTIPDPKQGILW